MKGGYTQYISSDFVVVSTVIPTSLTYQPPHLVASAVPSHVIITFVDLILLLISFPTDLYRCANIKGRTR